MKQRREQGSVLLGVLVAVLLAAIAVGGVTLTLFDRAQMRAKSREETRSFYAAEAGVNEVLSWFNTSGTAITQADPSLANFARYFYRDQFGEYDELKNLLLTAGAAGLDVTQVSTDLLPSLPRNEDRARVTSIRLFHENFDPLPGQHPPVADLVCIVRSNGKARLGNEKTIFSYLSEWTMRIDAPAGIMSTSGVDVNTGSALGHWGNVWSKARMITPLESQMKRVLRDDPWLRFQAELTILFDSTWGVPKWNKPYHQDDGFDVVDGTFKPCEGVVLNGTSYENCMYQNQTLEWPTYDYAEAKRLAQKKGRYYRTDAGGNLYRDGIMDADHLVADIEELNSPGDRSQWDDVDYDVVFVDTIDANPPAADGSNLATIKLSGSGRSWKGFYYVCANLGITGSPTSSIPCLDPSGQENQLKAFMDGILVVKGQVNISGNPVVYGSIYASGGFSGTGTMDVWYNSRLRDGFVVPIRPEVEIALWKATN